MPNPPRQYSDDELTPTPPVRPKAQPAKPPERPWTWHFTLPGIINNIKYELKRNREFNKHTPYAGRVGVMPLYFDNRPGVAPGTLRRQNASGSQIVHGGLVQMPVNAALNVTNLVQKAANGGKPADPESTFVGRQLNAFSRSAAQALGAKLPEEMSPGDKGFYTDLPASVTAGAAVTPYAAAVVGPTAFNFVGNPLAAQALRWTTGTALESIGATLIDDNTGGNIANLVTPNSPFAVGPEDDRVSAAFKSLLPNAGAEISAAGVFLGLTKVPSIARNLRQHRAIDEAVQGRQTVANAGVQEEVAPGEYQFNEGVAPAPEPATVADAKAQLIGDEPAPKPIPSQPMEMGGPVMEGKLPEADPAVDPFYDPSKPEVDVAAMGINRLDDTRLQQLADTQGPVMPEIERHLAEQTEGFALEEGLEGRLLSAPTESLQEPMVPYRDQMQSSSIPHNTLISAAHPSNSQVLHDRVVELTGRRFEEFTRADVIDGMESLSAEGLTFMPARLQEGQVLMDVGQIAVDPQRFQFKGGVDQAGVQAGNSLEGVSKWDTTAEGRIQVWEDPADGRYYVVNGHNRLQKAKDLGVPTLPVEVLIAKTPEQARAIGAASNIKAGSGTPFDAGKFIRERGITDVQGLEKAGMPLKSGLASKGFALSRLPEELFQEAVEGRLPMGRAIALGESGLDPDQMRWVISKTSGRDMSERAFEEFSQLVASAPQAISDQMGLFGPETISLSFEKAELAARVRAQLISNKNLLARVAKKRNAAVLQDKAGTTVDQAQAASAAQISQALLADFDATKYAEGTPLSQMLNEGASEIANGQNAGAIARDILNRLEAAASEAPPAIPPRVEAPVEAPTEAPPLTAEQRSALRSKVIQQVVANGEVRPTATPIPEVPPRPIANMAEAEADLLANGIQPGSPAAQALVDEIRLRHTYTDMDARQKMAIDEATREALDFDNLPHEEKIANGMLDGWEAPSQASAQPQVKLIPYADTVRTANRLGTANGRGLLGIKEDQWRAAFDRAGGVPDFLELAGGKANWEKLQQGLEVPDAEARVKAFVFPEAAPAVAAAIEIPAAASRRITSKTSDSRITGAAESLASWTAEPAKPPMSREKALEIVRAKGAILDPDQIPGLDMDAARSNRTMGRATPEVAAVYRQFYGLDGATPAAPAASTFSFPADLSKSKPRYGMATVAFGSDLDRAAYILRDGAKKSKGEDRLVAALEAQGYDIAQVRAHGSKVNEALKQAMRDRTGSARAPQEAMELAVPPQQFGGGRTSQMSRQFMPDSIESRKRSMLLAKENGPVKNIWDEMRNSEYGSALEFVMENIGDLTDNEAALIRGADTYQGYYGDMLMTLGQSGPRNSLERELMDIVGRIAGGDMKMDITDGIWGREGMAAYGLTDSGQYFNVGGVLNADLSELTGDLLLIARNTSGEPGFTVPFQRLTQVAVHEAVHRLQRRFLTTDQIDYLLSPEAVDYFRAEASKSYGKGFDQLLPVELQAWGSQRYLAARLLDEMASGFERAGNPRAATAIRRTAKRKLGEYGVKAPSRLQEALRPLVGLFERVRNWRVFGQFALTSELPTPLLEAHGKLYNASMMLGRDKPGGNFTLKLNAPIATPMPARLQAFLDDVYGGYISSQRPRGGDLRHQIDVDKLHFSSDVSAALSAFDRAGIDRPLGRDLSPEARKGYQKGDFEPVARDLARIIDQRVADLDTQVTALKAQASAGGC